MRFLPVVITLFSLAVSSSNQRAKPPQGTVLFINLLGKGLTPRASMGDEASFDGLPPETVQTSNSLFLMSV